jgi:hypothetical protein
MTHVAAHHGAWPTGKTLALAVSFVMIFSPWITFALGPNPWGHYFFLWIPIGLGAAATFAASRATTWSSRLMLTMGVPLALIWPTNVIGHSFAHLIEFCYD